MFAPLAWQLQCNYNRPKGSAVERVRGSRYAVRRLPFSVQEVKTFPQTSAWKPAHSVVIFVLLQSMR